MLPPETEARIRAFVAHYQNTGRGYVSPENAALLLAEIDRLRFQVQLLEEIAKAKREIEKELEGWTDHD